MDNNELLFLSLNQFIELKRDVKGQYNGFSFPSFYKVSRLKDKLPLSYNDSLILIHYLALQQTFLERNGSGFFKLSFEDIIIIEYKDLKKEFGEFGELVDLDCDNDNNSILYFAYLNSYHIKKINNKGNIIFNSPFIMDCFCAPEILALSVIPAAVSYKCFYYSLGALVIHCLGLGLDSDLEVIYHTKLYWLLKRIMVIEPNKRVLLLG
jgi:hypothetical protein